jgi:thiol:disulfide interchange protein DsbD
MASRLKRGPAALVLVLAAIAVPRIAAQGDPVKWSATAAAARVSRGDTFKVDVVAQIAEGWHLYALTQAPPPIATRVNVAPGQPFALAGSVDAPVPQSAFDPSFGIDTAFYAEEVAFTLPVRVAAQADLGPNRLKVQAYFQTCNDQFCLPPKTVTMEVAVEVAEAAPGTRASSASPPATQGGATMAPPRASASAARPIVSGGAAAPDATAVTSRPAAPPAPDATRSAAASPASAPGSAPAPVSGRPATTRGTSLLSFLWLAMTVGALSLLTPCVFPMVPITVSYFTNHAAGSRAKALQQAATYMAGIILTFTALGMAMALLVGATSLNRFAANPWINILITAIFLGFALSLFGVFDLQIPPALVNRLDALTRRQGGSQTLATLLMGLTFTLTSFTCTAPFVGTLLVMAAGGDWQWPLVGMLAFSTVFALPFFVLALMPQWMASLPKSGGWLNSVKVLMAFLEVAAAMKFISNVDLVWRWGLFTHDVVLATWVILFLMMAIYALGLFRFAHDAPVTHVGIARLGTSLVCGTIALWLLTGLVGKTLGEIEAFLPPPPEATQVAGLSAPPRELSWILNDYEQALARARREGRQVFIDFTGYTCTNCRWMEANMFPREDVRRELSRFVLVRLYTDGDGEVYQRQQQLQQAKYQTVALPFYAVVSADGDPLASFPGLTRDPVQFVAFLQRARDQGLGTRE